MRKLILLIMLACLLGGCAQQAAEIAPQEILGMDRITVATGDKALQSVKKMHMGSIEHIEDVAIFKYAERGDFIMLWVTTYPNSTVTQDETDKMVQAMFHFQDWGVNLQEFKVDGLHIYSLPRGDQMHYFWKNEYCMFYFVSEDLNSSQAETVIQSLDCDKKWI